MKQISEHGRRGAGADQPFGFERLHVGTAEVLDLGIEQPAVRPAQTTGSGSARFRAPDCEGRARSRSRYARRAGAEASERELGPHAPWLRGTVTPSRVSIVATASAAQVRSAASSTAASGCSATGESVLRQRAAEVVPPPPMASAAARIDPPKSKANTWDWG